MYGSVARMKVKPGSEDAFLAFGENVAKNPPPGLAFDIVYKLDNAEDEYLLVVGFTDKEAYIANSNSPEQQKAYEEYRALLSADPEWNDGEIVFKSP